MFTTGASYQGGSQYSYLYQIYLSNLEPKPCHATYRYPLRAFVRSLAWAGLRTRKQPVPAPSTFQRSTNKPRTYSNNTSVPYGTLPTCLEPAIELH